MRLIIEDDCIANINRAIHSLWWRFELQLQAKLNGEPYSPYFFLNILCCIKLIKMMNKLNSHSTTFALPQFRRLPRKID